MMVQIFAKQAEALLIDSIFMRYPLVCSCHPSLLLSIPYRAMGRCLLSQAAGGLGREVLSSFFCLFVLFVVVAGALAGIEGNRDSCEAA